MKPGTNFSGNVTIFFKPSCKKNGTQKILRCSVLLQCDVTYFILIN